MSLKLKSIDEAEKAAMHMVENFLHNGRTMISLKPKLTNPSLRNITLHGYNFSKGRIPHFTDNVSCVIGTEV